MSHTSAQPKAGMPASGLHGDDSRGNLKTKRGGIVTKKHWILSDKEAGETKDEGNLRTKRGGIVTKKPGQGKAAHREEPQRDSKEPCTEGWRVKGCRLTGKRESNMNKGREGNQPGKAKAKARGEHKGKGKAKEGGLESASEVDCFESKDQPEELEGKENEDEEQMVVDDEGDEEDGGSMDGSRLIEAIDHSESEASCKVQFTTTAHQPPYILVLEKSNPAPY
ncbi:hypothetical protein PAXINDRAFT_157243 [Paxillus involutus ATCC 200175]|uniref:Uncharacterized protein n=1 Tax=Paxillus involutus ATCC 200175 TaxID=664439 RepID=A0A0C9TWH7_PAXIN|nr:hypothetical protein PAXINDRAFT_157243 [Paxillus involutus ATCC 200175]